VPTSCPRAGIPHRVTAAASEAGREQDPHHRAPGLSLSRASPSPGTHRPRGCSSGPAPWTRHPPRSLPGAGSPILPAHRSVTGGSWPRAPASRSCSRKS